MIHEFAIENVLSFKDEQVISFEASSDKTYEEYHVVKKGNLRLLKLLLLYGANGSGKTNILLALEMLKDVILDKKNDKNEPVAVVPFLLDKTSRNKPSTFYLSFFIEQTRFIYSLVTDTERIL
ncbi:MAG: AAA family ATPase, partial [Bacteroidota bacterium]